MDRTTKDVIRVPGFLGSAVAAGIKSGGGTDLALIFSDVPARAAGVFTTNRFQAAPVVLDLERMSNRCVQSIIVNSGNANAATGEEGIDAVAMSKAVSDRLGIDDGLVLVASTGIIGERLPLEKIVGAVDPLVAGLSADGIPAVAKGIMTTDRFPKVAWRRCSVGGRDHGLRHRQGGGHDRAEHGDHALFCPDGCRYRPGLSRRCVQGIRRQEFQCHLGGRMHEHERHGPHPGQRCGRQQLYRCHITEWTDGVQGSLFDVMESLARDIVRDGEGRRS